MTYEEWKKQRNEGASSPWGSKANANYNKWLVESGKVDVEAIGNEINERVNTWLKNNENYILNAQDRFSVENPSYRADASDWLSTVTTQKSNFEKEAEGIKSMLDQYKGFFNEDYIKSVTQALDGNLKVQGDVISNSTKDLEYWSQWETEDAYNEYLAQQKDYEEKLNYDLGAGQKEIDWLQSVVDEYDKVQKPTYSNTDRGGSAQAKTDAYNAQIGAIAQKYGISYADAKAQLSEKSAYHTLAGRIQKAEELASVADVESVNYDPEFEKYANQGQSMDDGNTPWMFFGNTVADNPIEAWRRYYADSPNVEEDYGAGKIGKEASFALAMTEDEVKIYNYYLAKEGKNKAEEYLDIIAESVNSRVASGLFSQVEDKPVLEYAFAVAAGLDQFGTGVASIFSDEYKPTSATQIASGMIREDLADTGAKLPDWLGGGSLGQVGYDIINTTSNMLPSILASTAVNVVAPGAGAVVGAGLMGASAGGNAKQEMLNLGYSKEQATSYGLMVGAAEAGMEYLLGGITKLGGKLPDGLVGKILTKVDNAFARTAIKIGGSMASEGLEEGLQTVIEPWLKEIATGVDWDDPSVDEVLYSSLLGALSAFGLEGAGVVAGEVNTYKQGKKVQNVYAGVEKLQNIGSTFSADSVAYKIASKVNAQTDAYTIGRLLNEVGGTISEQNLTDIVNGLTQRGMDTKTATKLAKQYQSILNSEMSLTDEGVKILENLSPLADVLRTNIIGSNTTVYQRTRAYADLMSLANEVTNGKKSKSSKTATTEESSATEETPTNIFEQKNINSELQKMASEVATGSRTSLAGQALKRSVDSASASAAEKLGVEGKYTSSDTGATRLASNKKKVNIVGVDSIEDGALKLNLDDGSIVDADEIDFSTSDEALVYEAVTNMGVSSASAWEILKGYNPKSGQSGTIYAMGALEAYTYGHNGVKVDGMSKDGFSALLSPTQRNTANRLGDIDARAKVEAKQKTIDKAVKTVRDEARSKHKAIPKRNGEVVFDGDRARLTDLQKSQFNVIEKVAEGLGVTFHIFESKVDAKGKRYYKMPNGKITSANGWYDTKTGEIWIDLYAGNDGQGTMIFTAAHELTHFIRQWSPAKFKVFADFLFEQYGKKGQDVNQLVREQIQKAANNGRSISWDEAYEEVIADSCETFLRDSKASEKIAALREKDVSLANKIKTFLGQMLAKMRKLMADLGLAPETKEGKMVAEMTDSLQKLYDLWTDALADAGTAYSTLANIDLDTESVAPMFSERTWTASEYVTEREETAKKISKALGVDIKTAYKYIDDINSVARLIADDRARLDYEPNLDEHASVLKPNSDYKYSVDMSTLCAKRLLFTGTFDAIQRALPNTVFDSEDIVALREMMQDRGYEVACGICYVESTRREIGRITQDFINSYIESQKTGKPMTRINSEGKAVELKKTKDQKETTADKSTDKFFAEKDYTPTLADLNTTDIDLVKRDHPLVYEAYLNFMSARGQAKPKLLETRAEYKGEILTHFKSKSAVNARNNSGDLRLQSFSDFEVPHLIDMMQIIMDMSRVGLKSQAYTKVPAFAEIFGDTGVKINLSLIAKGDGLDANGNLVFDDVEGINHKEAFKLRDKYSKNVGTILVGKTDAHIIAAMADSRIDYIIPFHKSSWKESLYDALGLTGYADYTDYQNEKPIDKDRKIKNFDPSEYWDFSKSGDENAQIYLEKCREDGRIPKFPQFQGYPGYWKLLIDFKMYDNDGVGSPQEVVRPTFNTEASERILSEYKGGHRNFPVAKDVVEDFVRERRDNGVLYSERYQSAEENADIVAMASKVENGNFNANEKVYLGTVDAKLAERIQSLTGINTYGFKVAIEARQMEHILKDHGKNGIADRSMANPSDIAKMEYTLNNYDDISAAGRTQAYSYMVNGKNKTAPTVLYEKAIGEKSYYVVQAVPDTKAKTLYIVTAFIGKSGYKKEVSQLINAKSPDATSENGSATTSGSIISQSSDSVNRDTKEILSDRDSDGNTLSKEQQEFFKDSKIRDKNGNLMKVFHGSPNKFFTFRQGVAEGWGKGIYFTDNRNDASEYGDNIVEAYLNIKNPYNADTMNYEAIGGENTKAFRDFDMRKWRRWYPEYDTYEEYQEEFGGSGVDMYEIYTEEKEVFNQILRELGYDGIIAYGSNNIDGYEIVAFNENQPKLTTNKTPTSDADMRLSDRSPSSVSTRSLLANALETTAQNDIERNKLEQYKSKIDLIESEYDKLTELKAKIKELSFAKGARDTKAIKKLQFEANQTASRINVYDRQLLNLESTTALKNVLNREKELARRKEAQKGKEALARQKERQAKTIRTLMDKNTESRKKAIEGRNQTEMRHKIRKVVEELNNLLLNPTKDKHIPIGLQKPVASALAVINMDTVGADERIAKYNDLIAKSNNPDEIARLTKSRDNIELQGENLKDKLVILQNAYAALLKSDDPLIKNSHNEAIENLIESTIEKVGDTSIRNMSLEQLEAVYDMFKAIKATVRNANKMFKEGKQETITANSEWAKREVSAVGGHRDRVLKATKGLKKFGWNMLKPIYAMKLIGSDVLTSLYENVRKGEDTWAVDVNEAKDFFKETASKYEYNTWDFEKQYRFTDSAGHSFSLSLEQMMSLYAYSKRKQADKHLELGGFIFDDSIEVTKKNKLGIPMKYEVNDANPYRLKKEDLKKVISRIETDMPNVKGFVDEMQAYLSDVMGAKGNEVSLAMYDIKLYKEQNYFPLKSAKYFREFDPEKNGTPKIKNSGFSKNTVPQAGNPIVLSNFMDVWANHVNDMSMYHAFVLPLEDFMRVYNYSSTAGGYDSVQQYIKNAYGVQANTYIETLMNDLNGGARTDPATDLIGKGMSLFKKAAVFASASVVIQQPSAIARAMAYVDAKYFVDKPEATKHSETWAEVKKYAPVAIIKEMGYFDTNMGRSTVDWIKEEKTWRDKVDDIASKAPALADELAWCAIWKAVKREIADSTNLKVGSEAFLKMAGKRFTEVVTKTQVYDSVLSRSALMRSKDSGAKMVTAFMAEPTTSLNMVVDAIIEGKRGNKKFAGKVIGAVSASIILNSILVSLVTAARDDDDDETYAEKYLESITAELLDGFNPLTYIPLVKDIWSIMQGFDIERSDMSIWSDLWQSVENLFSDNKSGFEKTEGVVGSIASIFGLPLKNLMRDARGIYNLASTLLSGTPTTWAGVGEAVGGAVKDSIPLYSRIEKWVGADTSKSDKLYNAIMSGDQNQIDRVMSQYKDDKAVESAIRQGLRENDSRIHEAAQARYDGDIEEYKRIAKEIIAEGYFSQDTVVAAINAEINAIKKGETSEEDQSVDTTEKVTSIYKASDINDAFESGDTDMALEVIDDLFNTKVENYLAEARKEAEEDGKTFNERKAQAEAESKAKSSIRSSMTSYWKPLYKEAYKSGNTAEKERIERILKASRLYGNASEVIKTCREWRTERD